MRQLRMIYAALAVAGLYAGLANAQATAGNPDATATIAPKSDDVPLGAPAQSIMFAGRWSGATAGPLATSLRPVALDNTTSGDQYISGRALIGATTPAPLEKLHIAGGNITVRTASNANGMISPFIGFGPAGSGYPRTNAYLAAQYANPWYSAADLLFYTTSASDITMVDASEKMRITGNGNVGIGTIVPANNGLGVMPPPSRLSVYSSGPTTIAMGNTAAWGATNTVVGYLSGRADGQAEPASFGGIKIITDSTNWYKGRLGFFTNASDGTAPYAPATEKMTVTASGNVGIGTTIPTALLQIGPIGTTASTVQFLDRTAQGQGFALTMTSGSEIDVAGLNIGASSMPAINTTSGPLILQYSAGDVEIGSGSHGNLTVHGTVYANYQDVAEWVPAAQSMTAGTVVVISNDTNNTVTASTHAYDTGVAGVVSPTPGLLLGVASDSKAKIATTGRVKVRVDASKGPIQKGDLLVTSDRPGMAMKSEPLDLGGTKIHRPGTLVGKALEPLASGQGEILVLLSLQ